MNQGGWRSFLTIPRGSFWLQRFGRKGDDEHLANGADSEDHKLEDSRTKKYSDEDTVDFWIEANGFAGEP